MTLGESKYVVKVLREFSEATEMTSGSRSGLYIGIFFRGVDNKKLAWEVYPNLGYHNQMKRDYLIMNKHSCSFVTSF